MARLDALLVHPNGAKTIYQDLSFSLKALEPPLWAGLLAANLKNSPFSVDLLDAEAMNYSVEETLEQINLRDPRLVIIVVYGLQPSASTQTMVGAHLLCKSLKETHPQFKILMVGGHVSALPERTLREEECDFVCQGEGPATIRGLLHSNMEEGEHLKKIPGLWFRQDHHPTFTFSAPLIPSARLPQEFPGLSWDLLPMDRYRAHNWHAFEDLHHRSPYVSLYTSLGCPFRCSFCCINAPFGKNTFRFWDPSFMVSQIDHLVQKYGVRNIKFSDEMFVLKENHFLELCRLLIERNYDLNIWAYTRVDTIKPHYLEILRKAGVRWLVVGIETATAHVRSEVSKNQFDQTDIYSTIRMIREQGIHVLANYIFGLPQDDLHSMKETLALAQELNTEFANFYSAMAYPGSPLYQTAREKNWPLPASWAGYSQHSYEAFPLPTAALSSGEILGFRDYAWQTYFQSPSYLGMIGKKFGGEVVEHITRMTEVPLRRKFAVPYQSPTTVPQEFESR